MSAETQRRRRGGLGRAWAGGPGAGAEAPGGAGPAQAGRRGQHSAPQGFPPCPVCGASVPGDCCRAHGASGSAVSTRVYAARGLNDKNGSHNVTSSLLAPPRVPSGQPQSCPPSGARRAQAPPRVSWVAAPDGGTDTAARSVPQLELPAGLEQVRPEPWLLLLLGVGLGLGLELGVGFRVRAWFRVMVRAWVREKARVGVRVKFRLWLWLCVNYG